MVPNVGFEDETVVLVLPVQHHCLPFNFNDSVISLHGYFRLLHLTENVIAFMFYLQHILKY